MFGNKIMINAEINFAGCNTPAEVEAARNRKCAEIRKAAQIKMQQQKEEHEKKMTKMKKLDEEINNSIAEIREKIKVATENGDFELVMKLFKQQSSMISDAMEKSLADF